MRVSRLLLVTIVAAGAVALSVAAMPTDSAAAAAAAAAAAPTAAPPSRSPWLQALPDGGDLLAELKIDIARIAEAISTVPAAAPFRPSPTGGDKCCECARGVGEHVLASTLELIDTACAAAPLPPCKWIDEHKEEFTGYLVAKLRPMHDGFLYCMGNGTCAHPNSTNADALAATFDAQSPALLLPQLTAASAYVSTALKSVFDVKQDEEPMLEKDENLEDADEEESEESSWDISASPPVTSSVAGNSGSRQKCHKCLRHGVRYVMKRALKHIKRVCKHTTCPKLQKFCAWAKEHKQFVRGVVYAEITPFRYAIGYCAGNGKCHHSSVHADVAALPFTMKGGKDGDAVETTSATIEPATAVADKTSRHEQKAKDKAVRMHHQRRHERKRHH